MASNYGIPPPPGPPPPRPNGGPGAASFQGYPPPPPPQTASQYHQHQPNQQSMHTPMSYHGMPQQGFQQQHPGHHPPANYQYPQYQSQPGQPAYQYQYNQQQQMHQQQSNQYSYNQQQQQQPQYANNYAPAPHPPPPPPPPRQGSNFNNSRPNPNTNNASQMNVNAHSGHSNSTNADAAASLRQNLAPANPNPSKNTNNNYFDNDKNNNDKPKKVNPKMAKKYAGRGLKSITISGPGLPTRKFKICVGNHPDDIKKWIEERKKRFPRVNNNNNNGSSELAGMKRSRQEEEAGQDAKKPCLDDNDKAKSDGASKEEGTETGGLSGLLAGYDSSSSKENDSDLKGGIVPLKSDSASAVVPQPEGDNIKETNQCQPRPKKLCRFYQRGKCHHGDNCKYLHSLAPRSERNQKNRQSQSERDKERILFQRELQILGLATPGHGSRYTSGGKVINSTSLLGKLLQRDKERERRLTLQILRYIADCDYFQGDGTEVDGTAIVTTGKSDGCEEEEEEEEEGEVKDDEERKQSCSPRGDRKS